MKYTKGIRKLFEPNSDGDLVEAQRLALNAGFTMLLFNGVVYLFAGDEWHLTDFRITDFEC